MKRILLTILGLSLFISGFNQNQAAPDHSFVLSEDTLWFIIPDDFVYGKEFRIINEHNYPIEITQIDQYGSPCYFCTPWYISPYVSTFPLTIPANGSITELVRFTISDNPAFGLAYDTLNVSSATNADRLIIAVDSAQILIGISEPAKASISVSPNPFSERTRITIRSDMPVQASLEVFDGLNRLVTTLFNGELSSGISGFILNGRNADGINLAPGCYFLRLNTPAGTTVFKVIKS